LVTLSYPTFRDATRVYSLVVMPVRRKKEHGCVSESYMLGDGMRLTVEHAPRFSAKRLAALATDPKVLEAATKMHAQIMSRFDQRGENPQKETP
jgi:hypothetical protein